MRTNKSRRRNYKVSKRRQPTQPLKLIQLAQPTLQLPQPTQPTQDIGRTIFDKLADKAAPDALTFLRFAEDIAASPQLTQKGREFWLSAARLTAAYILVKVGQKLDGLTLQSIGR